MPEAEKPTPWYLLLHCRQVRETLHAAIANDSRIVIPVPGLPVSFAENLSTCVMALQALRRGKIHRQSIPQELRDHCATTGNRISWSFEHYAHILAETGARAVLAHLVANHNSSVEILKHRAAHRMPA